MKQNGSMEEIKNQDNNSSMEAVKGNNTTAVDNNSGKDITDKSDKAYMTDTEKDNSITDKSSKANIDSPYTEDKENSNSTEDINKTVRENNNSDMDDNNNTVDTDNDNKAKSNRFDFRQYNASLTPEERQERARRAGIASGQARRERRTLGEELTAILSEGDNQQRLCMALFTSALSGNYKAFNSLRDTIGEMPTVKQEVTASITEADKDLLDKVSKRLNITE